MAKNKAVAVKRPASKAKGVPEGSFSRRFATGEQHHTAQTRWQERRLAAAIDLELSRGGSQLAEPPGTAGGAGPASRSGCRCHEGAPSPAADRCAGCLICDGAHPPKRLSYLCGGCLPMFATV